MSPAKFNVSLNDIDRLLKKLGLAAERIFKPDYRGLASKMRAWGHVDEWQQCYRGRIYDFKLFDSSLLQFQLAPLSYSYIECPFDIPTFDAFLAARGDGTSEELAVATAEYEGLMSSAEPKTTTPFRFDYDPPAYREGLHPAAHVHVGFRSNIRLATERVLTPMSFLLFVLRQCYPDHWAKLLGKSELKAHRGEVRTGLVRVAATYRKAGDMDELYLT